MPPRTALAGAAFLAALALQANAAPKVERVTTATALHEVTDAAVSRDGRYVAVAASATAPTVVAGVYAPNWSGTPVVGPTLAQPVKQVYLVDRVARTATLVSAGTGSTPADAPAISPSISADGRYVAFQSTATNLAKGTTQYTSSAYLYDRVARRLSLVSVDWRGKPLAQGVDNVRGVWLSADGSTVFLRTAGAVLRSGDPGGGGSAVFARDRRTGRTVAVTRRNGAVVRTYGNPHVAASKTGRYVVVSEDDMIYLYDTRTGQARVVRGPAADDARCPQALADVNGCTYVVHAMAVDQNGARVAYAVTANGSTRVLTVDATGKTALVASFAANPTSLVSGLAFAPDGGALYYVGPPAGGNSATGLLVLYRYGVLTQSATVLSTLPAPAGCRTDGCATTRLASVAPFVTGVLFTTDAPLVADDTDGLMDAYAITG